MSLFNKPQNPDNTPSEARLREWGDAERATPPIRRGRFANVADRLTRAANPESPPQPWYRPAFVLSGVSLVAVTVGMAVISDPITDRPEPTQPTIVPTQATKANSQTLSQSRLSREQKFANGWESRKLTKHDGGFGVRVDPVFISGNNFYATAGYRSSAIVPFVVTIRNDGEAFTGKITVSLGDARNPGRTYTYPVTISGNSTFRTTLYPEITSLGEQNIYNIRLVTPTRTLSMDSGFAVCYGNSSTHKTVAILDNRIGVLSPRRVQGSGARNSSDAYQPVYAKPENAPERANGYDAVDVLALGYGCENLSAAQWTAIQEWVKEGGSLVLLGGSEEMRRVLSTPAALALSPAEQFATETRTTLPQLQVSYFNTNPSHNGYYDYNANPMQVRNGKFAYDLDMAALSPRTLSIIARAKADAKVIYRASMERKSQWAIMDEKSQWATIGARRTLGAGSVTFYGFDPTVASFRSTPVSLVKWWESVAKYDKGVVPSVRMARLAHVNMWEKGLYESGPDSLQEQYIKGELARTDSKNPFITQFPDLRLVLYIFLGYFVLVVPVSFVVLKQTRRMQYAWFTGPLLAVTFAGGLAMFTRSLYEASRSVRTSGILAMEAGDGTARFHGMTELYVPKATQMTLELPGTQQSFKGYGGDFNGGESLTFISRITDSGSGEQPPVVDIPNLAFRRFYHSQTVTLGNGITATLRPSNNGTGSLVGTINNSSGSEIHYAEIDMRGDKTVMEDGATFTPVWRWSVDRLPTGTTPISLEVITYPKGATLSDLSFEVGSLPPRTPILTGNISGKQFAPKQAGQWVGSETSVRMIVKLPAIPENIMPDYTPPQSRRPVESTPAGFAAPNAQGGITR